MNMRVVIVIVAVLALVLAAVIIFRGPAELKNTTKADVDDKLLPLYVPVLERVEIEPAEPTSDGFIRAVPVLKNARLQFVKYRYTWFVNGEEVKNPSEGLLDPSLYRKGDTVACRVAPFRGGFEGPAEETSRKRVGNGSPVLQLTPLSSFQVPGEFSYRIQARDPDNDPLTYKLVSPQGKGIQLDEQTGELRWHIQSLPAPESRREPMNPADEGRRGSSSKSATSGEDFANASPVVRIIFQVSDADGAAVEGAITLDLVGGGEVAF